MPFPATMQAMIDAGYTRSLYTRCQGCGAVMEYWRTPTYKTIPMDPMTNPEDKAVSHFATCVKAEQFRKTRRKPPGRESKP
jgi:hypothetical protein